MSVVAATDAIEFVPSRVEGADYVGQVRVHSDRLEVFSAGRWIAYPFLSFAPGREIRDGLIPIGVLNFSRIHYYNSNFVFFTRPPIRIYMPADGPVSYPDSHFWRIQQRVRQGGFKFFDSSYPPYPLYFLRSSPLKTTLYVSAVLAFFWICGLAVILPGITGQRMRDFLLSNSQDHDLGLIFSIPAMIIPSLLSLYHGRNATRVALAIIGGFLIVFVSEVLLCLLIDRQLPAPVATHQLSMSPVSWLVTLAAMAIMSGLIGKAWRGAFMEPIARPSRM